MQELLEISLAFPTAVFTALLALSVLFWALMAVGGAGIDLFDIDLDFDVSGAEEAGSSIFQVLSFFGVGTVPMSIFATVVVFWGWILSVLSVYAVGQMTTIGLLSALGILVGVTVLSIPLSGVVVYPLKALFEGSSGCESGNEIIGGVCKITSSRVDEIFGRARFQTEGSELVITVRCDKEVSLSRGDKALIIDFDEESNIYRVESVDALFNEQKDFNDEMDQVVLQDAKNAAARVEKEQESQTAKS